MIFDASAYVTVIHQLASQRNAPFRCQLIDLDGPGDRRSSGCASSLAARRLRGLLL